MNDKEQFFKDPKHVPGEVFSHLPRPKKETLIQSDREVFFGMAELWKLPILLARRLGKSEINVAFHFEEGYVSVNLKSEELEVPPCVRLVVTSLFLQADSPLR